VRGRGVLQRAHAAVDVAQGQPERHELAALERARVLVAATPKRH
jgi:hypothetical protein